MTIDALKRVRPSISKTDGPDDGWLRSYSTGGLGSVLITNESDSVSVAEMVQEFGIELLDDYFARSLVHHHQSHNATCDIAER